MDPNGEQAGKAFLAANKAKAGVTTLSSGLQYRVLEEGSGLAHPTVSTPCECHYSGRLLDGTEFDSSYKRGTPSTFAPNQVIAGWTEAMQLMVQGDKWEMYIPFGLAYGARGKPPRIPPAAALIFVMEIVEIKGKTTPKVASSRAGTSSDAREEGSKGGKAAQTRDGEGRPAEAPKRKHESEARQRDSSDSSDSDSSSDSEERRRKKQKKEKKEKKEKKRKDKHKSSKGKKEKHKKDKGKKHKKEEVVERSIISGKPLLKKLDKTDEDHARDAKRQQLLAFLNDAY